MADLCTVWDCRKHATRRLVIAMETQELGAVKISMEACQEHGDALDEHGGLQYLVTDSQGNGWSVTPDAL